MQQIMNFASYKLSNTLLLFFNNQLQSVNSNELSFSSIIARLLHQQKGGKGHVHYIPTTIEVVPYLAILHHTPLKYSSLFCAKIFLKF